MDDCEYVVQGAAEERMFLPIPPPDPPPVVIWGIAPRSPAVTTPCGTRPRQCLPRCERGCRNPGLVLGSTCSSSGIRRPARTSRATYQERCDMYGTRCAPQVHAACLLDLIFLFRLYLSTLTDVLRYGRRELPSPPMATHLLGRIPPRAVVLPPSRAPQATHTLHLRTTGPGSALSRHGPPPRGLGRYAKVVAGSAAVHTASRTGRKAEDKFDETEADRAGRLHASTSTLERRVFLESDWWPYAGRCGMSM
ncbi:hypothetical protein B0H11DRAFT_2101561, partial [Mycena galericulata]